MTGIHPKTDLLCSAVEGPKLTQSNLGRRKKAHREGTEAMRNGLEESAGRLFVKWHQLVTSRGHAVKLITKPEFGQGWSNKTII
jgi:hypothetical protein